MSQLDLLKSGAPSSSEVRSVHLLRIFEQKKILHLQLKLTKYE